MSINPPLVPLEKPTVAPATGAAIHDVSPESKQILKRTAVTSETSLIVKGDLDQHYEWETINRECPYPHHMHTNKLLSDEEIEAAKSQHKYASPSYHQHSDCIRIAFQWLDAQKTTKNPTTLGDYGLKHTIRQWAGRYISSSDVIVAAFMHPKIEGVFPYFNISRNYTVPSLKRLEGIGEAFKHESTYEFNMRHYKYVEEKGTRVLASKIIENEWRR